MPEDTLHWKNISPSVLNVLGGQVNMHLALTEIPFSRMNTTTY